MSTLHALIFGLVEGITEFLPISSTGHLMLTSIVLGLTQTDFLKTFEISIQLGAILSVVVLYWRRLLTNWEVMKRIAMAFIPTGIIGFFVYKTVKNLLSNISIVPWTLLIGGILLIIFELWHKKRPEVSEQKLEDISYAKYFLVGVIQSVSMIPGVSRSAATIIGGLGLGFSRKNIVEFSFLLAVPTVLAATGYDLLKNASAFSASQFNSLAIGFVASFITALLAIKFLMSYIQKHSFIAFGIYRIAIAILFLLAIL
ncbi:MAG: undecaprenyl-diphosphatase UppP [Patescibacteria group bacterium]|jgi:undecaprenyl-diphosphatase